MNWPFYQGSIDQTRLPKNTLQLSNVYNDVGRLVTNTHKRFNHLITAMGQGYSPILNEVNIPVMLKEICSSPLFYGSEIMPGMICAGYVEGRKDSCQVSF